MQYYKISIRLINEFKNFTKNITQFLAEVDICNLKYQYISLKSAEPLILSFNSTYIFTF